MKNKHYKYVKFDDINVGDKFRLVGRPEISRYDIACGFNENMKKHFGDIVTVEDKDITPSLDKEYVLVEENGWSWDIRFLEKVEDEDKTKEIVKVLKSQNEIFYNDVLNYKFKKAINNDNAVILFFENKYTGNVIKTVAICDYEDIFNLEKGLEIAYIKMLRKIANKEYNKFIR